MSAKDWVVANKIKTGLGLVATLSAVVVLPVSFVTWAADQTAQQIFESELIQQGRYEAIHSTQAHEAAKLAAKHDYDFYDIRAQQAELELVQLEEDMDAGVQLTASEQRKMRRLEAQVEAFNEQKDEALERLAEVENHDEAE